MKADDRPARIWTSIREQADREALPAQHRHVCQACAAALDGSVGLTMSDGKRGLAQAVASTDEIAAALDERQVTLGEGPGIDVIAGHAALLVDDIAADEYALRWPIFTESALARGVRAVFAFPLRASLAELGVLTVYRSRAGGLSDEEFADGLAYADAALALTLDRTPYPQQSLDDLFTPRRSAIHQACGMVSVQLGGSLADALARLRAHAYANDLMLSQVAADVVARKLRFDDNG